MRRIEPGSPPSTPPPRLKSPGQTLTRITKVTWTPDVVGGLDEGVVAAAATPLPGSDDGSSDGSPPPVPLPLPLSSPAQPKQWVRATQPPAPTLRPSLRTREGTSKTASSTRCNLARQLLVVVVLASAAAGAWLYLQQHPQEAADLRSHVSAAADALYARGRQAVFEARQRVQQARWAAGELLHDTVWPRVRGLWPGLTEYRDEWGSDSTSWSASDIAALLPEGAAWDDVAADIAERLREGSCGDGGGGCGEDGSSLARTGGPSTGRKGTGLLLGCATDSDCEAAAAALPKLRGVPPGCALRLDGASFAREAADLGGGGGDGEQALASAAALQAALASFLPRCPTGLVVVLNAQRLPIESLPALHSALSELGGFQHGGPVDASRAAYALLARLPSADQARRGAALGDPSEVASWLKDAFFEGMLEPRLVGMRDQERATAVFAPMLRALRRRLDFAVPVRMSTGAVEAADAEGELAAGLAGMVEEEGGSGGGSEDHGEAEE